MVYRELRALVTATLLAGAVDWGDDTLTAAIERAEQVLRETGIHENWSA